MAKKINFRARVMKYAWQILRATKMAWSYCLKKAWMLYKLWDRMKQETVLFSYFKSDGTLRFAKGTLRFNKEYGGDRKLTKPSYKTMKYFDLEKKAFRCFKVENIVSIGIS